MAGGESDGRLLFVAFVLFYAAGKKYRMYKKGLQEKEQVEE